MMRIRVVLAAAATAAAIVVPVMTTGQQAPAPQPNTWILGDDAETKKNPLTPDAGTLASGKAIYTDKCQRCHGPGGLGDGEDADPDAAEDMDLTAAKRAARNPDGVVYYKVLNGRRRPKMPAFKGELTEQQLWSVVTYVQSLRKKQP